MRTQIILIVYITFFILEYGWERFLEILNIRYSENRKDTIPSFIESIMTIMDYRKSIEYTHVKAKFNIFFKTATSILILLLIVSGSLGFIDTLLAGLNLHIYTHSVLYILFIALLFRLFSLPFSLYSQFAIEERFGFNKMTLKLFFTDLLKGLAISLVLIVPLLYALFFFMDKAGSMWWLYALGMYTLFQFFIILIYPTVIAPLFNKFTPLEEGTLRDKIFALAKELGFKTEGIFVVDGSKRSAHSNAYFTGIGKTKRIVLFDTLIESLGEQELVAVLAHEIGHYKKNHNKKRLIFSTFISLAVFFVLSLLLQWPDFFTAFGFSGPSYHAVLVLVLFCSGPFTFFLTPIVSIVSRKHEYEADRYAVAALNERKSLKNALLCLHKENLSNPVPHPLYSYYHYSHPTLSERMKALEN